MQYSAVILAEYFTYSNTALQDARGGVNPCHDIAGSGIAPPGPRRSVWELGDEGRKRA